MSCVAIGALLVCFTAVAQVVTYGPGQNLLTYKPGASETRPIAQDLTGNWGTITERGLVLSLRFKKKTFGVGEPLQAIILVRNLSTNEYTFDFAPKVSFTLTYEGREAVKEQPGPPLETSSGFSGNSVLLKPGTQLRYVEPLKVRFKFERPGLYVVTATMHSVDQMELRSGNALVEITDGPVPNQPVEPEPRATFTTTDLLPPGFEPASTQPGAPQSDAAVRSLEAGRNARDHHLEQGRQLASNAASQNVPDDQSETNLASAATTSEASLAGVSSAWRRSKIFYGVMILASAGALALVFCRSRHKERGL